VISDGAAGFAGGLNIGRSANETTPYTRVIITGNNTYTGTTQIRRAIVVVGSNTAFGTTGLVTLTGATGQMMAALESDDDARTIGTTAGTRYNQFARVQGNHSLTFITKVAQGNSRSFGNFLPADKVLTFNDCYAATDNTARVWTFEGPGRTIVNGNLLTCDQSQGAYGGALESFEKRGTGTVTINSTASNYNGGTRVRGGLMEFATIAGVGSTTGATVDAGGALGLLSGSTNPAFLTLLGTGGGAGPATTVGGAQSVVSYGALALAPSDASVPLDFVAGNMSAANVQNMGIGAVSGGITYLGTISPFNSTYKLGGGGDLTLPNPNQLTGGNAVRADNGGKVIVTNSNNYTGVTKIGGSYLNPTQLLAAAGAGTSLVTTPFSLRVNSTLSTSVIANGGASSGIGASSNDASNLLLDGGTFQYTGAAGSTDRLFTINPNGATLDASGTGPISFSNPGAIVSADAGAHSGNINGTPSAQVLNLDDISDLTPGMTIAGANIPAGTTIAGLMTPSFGNIGNTGSLGLYQIILSQAGTAGATGPLTFGNQNRTLNLTGSNPGNNTIAGVLSDSATGKLSVAKSGAGKWVLGGNSTYTGGTTVSGGILEFATKIPNGPVTISGGTLKVAAKGTPNSAAGTSVVPSLTITGSTLDLTNNSMIIDYNDPVGTLVSDVRGYLKSGKMTTSSGTATTRLGYADNAVLGKTTFGGVSVDTSSVLIKYTYAGDADLDGDADGVDIGTWATNFTGELGGTGSQVWTQGDWDYDGDVDGVDAGLWAQAFTGELGGNGLGSVVVDDPNIAPGAAAILRGLGITVVPEPVGLGLLTVGLAGLLRRRRR
jgi:fibronectin-binding autotransporter adhesin